MPGLIVDATGNGDGTTTSATSKGARCTDLPDRLDRQAVYAMMRLPQTVKPSGAPAAPDRLRRDGGPGASGLSGGNRCPEGVLRGIRDGGREMDAARFDGLVRTLGPDPVAPPDAAHPGRGGRRAPARAPRRDHPGRLPAPVPRRRTRGPNAAAGSAAGSRMPPRGARTPYVTNLNAATLTPSAPCATVSGLATRSTCTSASWTASATRASARAARGRRAANSARSGRGTATAARRALQGSTAAALLPDGRGRESPRGRRRPAARWGGAGQATRQPGVQPLVRRQRDMHRTACLGWFLDLESSAIPCSIRLG